MAAAMILFMVGTAWGLLSAAKARNQSEQLTAAGDKLQQLERERESLLADADSSRRMVEQLKDSLAGIREERRSGDSTASSAMARGYGAVEIARGQSAPLSRGGPTPPIIVETPIVLKSSTAAEIAEITIRLPWTSTRSFSAIIERDQPILSLSGLESIETGQSQRLRLLFPAQILKEDSYSLRIVDDISGREWRFTLTIRRR
jgi:hypothetical protein